MTRKNAAQPRLHAAQALILCLAIALTLSSCGHSRGTAGFRADSTVYVPRHAHGFRIDGARGRQSTLITITNPWQGAHDIRQQLLILRGGESSPPHYDGQVLHGDARRVVAMSSSHIAMLDAFGSAGLVTGVSGIGFVTNRDIQRRRATVADVGYDGNIDYEALLALRPDIVTLYGVTGASAVEAKLRELGIPFIYIGDYVEESPLGKAEWMLVMAEITGRRAAGLAAFRPIPRRYEAMRRAARRALESEPPVRVMLNTPYLDTWFMPAAASYSVQLINDAGGQMVYAPPTGSASQAVDMERAYQLAATADVWLNVGTCRSLGDLMRQCPKFADIPAVRQRHVYNNTLRSTPGGGNDYWESGVVRPDAVLADLIRILHPTALPRADLNYYLRLQ